MKQNDLKDILQIAKDLRSSLGWPDRCTIRTMEDELRNFPYGAAQWGGETFDQSKLANKMVAWCTKQFGPRNRGAREDWRWEHINGKFWFKNEDDRLLFVLKWS